MSLQTRLVDYADRGMTFQGMLAWNDAADRVGPGVLIAHTIRGRSQFEEAKARALAERGYVAFAIDVYGKTELQRDADRSRGNMEALLADRAELQRRLLLSLSVLRQQSEVDEQQVAAIGFCFGGLCVLDIARSGEELAGVVSFHGLLQPPETTGTKAIKAKVLVLHGWDDPLAPPDSVVALAGEMSRAGADWQLHAYGNTVHAFTNPAADDRSRGTVYDAAADRRSWIAMQDFLRELFDH